MVASYFVYWEEVDEDGRMKDRFVENFKSQKDWGSTQVGEMEA